MCLCFLFEPFYVLQLIPVNSSIGLIEATDVDSQPLYYRLETTTVRQDKLCPNDYDEVRTHLDKWMEYMHLLFVYITLICEALAPHESTSLGQNYVYD